jgi:GNAT superfamily N-acetyltransferase
MRYVLTGAGVSYREALPTLVYMFVMARVLRGEPIVGVGERGALAGAALVSRPDGAAPPTEFETLREAVWGELGAAARARYEAFGAAKPVTVSVPHLHLNVLGVRRDAQGGGVGRRLLEHVQSLSRDDATSQGVTLTTEDPVNVALYEHCGFEVVGHARVAPELETWGMFRKNA